MTENSFSKNQENKKKRKKSSSFYVMVAGSVVMIIAVVLTAVTFTLMLNGQEMLVSSVEEDYDKHYVFIVDDKDGEFYSQVLLSAADEATSKRVYIEDLEASIGVNYTDEDLLRVAINSKVDGIIYSGTRSEKAVILIDKAVTKGIGVVVLQNDIDSSIRQCFIGANNYEIGRLYASQIFELFGRNDLHNKKVTILADSDMAEGATNLVTMAIEDALLESIEEEQLPEIEIQRIEAEDTFSVEEDIRNIFIAQSELPDVMICMSDAFTQCAYQAIVDYNRVGEVKIIGFYADDTILDAIDKDIIYSTIALDTDEMGRSAIQALSEYCDTGYTNSYVSVGTQVIGKKEAKTLLNEQNSTVD